MLKRVALVGKGKGPEKSVAEAARKRDLLIVPVKKSGSAPPVSAALLPDDGTDSMLDMAASLAGQSEELIHLLAEAIDCRESFQPGGSRRVMDHASRLGEALNLSDEERIVLERGALVRDIGKLKIPNEVLLKNTVLSYDEWTMLQQHTNIGADLVRDLSSLRDTEDIVRRHHEAYDGDGYPDGLEGEKIPYLARIMKVVDVYCAMTSPRPYRSGVHSHDEAIDHLESEREKHFDPAVVDVFVNERIGQTAAG